MGVARVRGVRRLTPGERRHGFVMPVPHTRSARKAMQMYLRALRPLAHEIAAALPVSDEHAGAGAPPQEVGAVYLRAFFDELSARLEHD
jgi:hypothetical protein